MIIKWQSLINTFHYTFGSLLMDSFLWLMELASYCTSLALASHAWAIKMWVIIIYISYCFEIIFLIIIHLVKWEYIYIHQYTVRPQNFWGSNFTFLFSAFFAVNCFKKYFMIKWTYECSLNFINQCV